MQRRYSTSVRVYYPRYSREEVIHRLREALQPVYRKLGVEKAILFGSYATGRSTAASDIDLLVVVDTALMDKDEVYKLIRKSIGLRMVELHMLTKDEYKELQTSRWIKTIEKEGVTIVP